MALVMILRLIHLTLGVFWAGSVFYIVLFLMPSMTAAGPAGGRVMQELVRRGQLTYIPIAGALTILSGLGLMWWVSGGFDSSWFGSPGGITISTGMLAALVAFVFGMSVLRPTVLRIGALAGQAQALEEGPEKGAIMAQVGALQARAGNVSRWIAVILLVAVVTMAVARYV